MPRGRPRSVPIAEVPTEPETPVQDVPLDVDEAPKPEAELTAEQRRIRELEDQLAKERGGKEPEIELEKPKRRGAKGNIILHFLEDGFTALGHIWYRGQELEFEPGSRAYQDTCDRNGKSWVDLVDDEFAQVDRWGRVMFRRGPWPAKTLADAGKLQFEQLKSLTKDGAAVPIPSEEELTAAALAEKKRGRAAPRLPQR